MTVSDIEERKLSVEERLAALIESDQQCRDALPIPEVAAYVREPGRRLIEVIEHVMSAYADRPGLAMRRRYASDSGDTISLADEFTTVSYRDTWQRVTTLASVWHAAGLRPGDAVAILGFSSTDYAIVDLACLYLGAVSVPLQFGASASSLQPVLAEVNPRVIAVSGDQVATMTEALASTEQRPASIVAFDVVPGYHPHQKALAALAAEHTVVTLDALLAQGDAVEPIPPHIPAEGEDPVVTILYTSGSTGLPKGALYTERMSRSNWIYPAVMHGTRNVPSLHVHYMPLSHMFGRSWLAATLGNGGTVHFTASSDMSTLLEDLALVRPTALALVPRVCEMVYQHQRHLGRSGSRPFGDRVMSAVTGTAPLSQEIRLFLQEELGLHIIDGYGSTETGVILADNKINPRNVLDYKLVDVPELGYFTTDTPFPRGELLVKTKTMTPGYYNRPDVLNSMFDDDGFYCTGDVMALTGPDELRYVDRRKNVVKLSHGEFVAVSKLETLFVSSPHIRQIFVYASSERSFLLAVVVPETGSTRVDVMESLHAIAAAEKLQSYEIPRDVLLEDQPFTVADGLISIVGKLLRPQLTQRYGAQLEKLYDDLAVAQDDELAQLRSTAGTVPTAQTVVRAAQAVLGLSTPPDADSHFTDLGGDSLSALTLSTLLRDVLDTAVPVGVITSPASTLAALAAYVDSERASIAIRPRADNIHPDTGTLRAAELRLEAFLDEATLRDVPAPDTVATEPKTVLLTGANGYLGRFLCLEWLTKLAPVDGTLICVIRARDDEAARARLDEVFLGTEMAKTYEQHRDSLVVLAGDVSEPSFGLQPQQWADLALRADAVVHAAALVNHVLPYDQLFGPNVVGTAEVIRLALTARIKPVSFLSTVAVAVGVGGALLTEDVDIRTASPTRSTSSGYVTGYGDSKWAGEVLLREANERFGLPVTVFRSDMILAHSTFGGQLNVADVFTRLVLSVLATGLAPQSFYRGDAARAHYDGLPADFTAAAITELGVANPDGYRTYDVVNPHDDGVSLDTVVDWLVESGERIHRIDDHAEWVDRITTVLRALDERQRAHSLLPVLDAYRVPAPAIAGSAIPAERFAEAVGHTKALSAQGIPHLTRELIEKYAADLRSLGLV